MAPGGCEGAPPTLKPQIGCGPGGKIYVDMPTSQPRRTHNCSAMPMSAGDPPAPCCHCGHGKCFGAGRHVESNIDAVGCRSSCIEGRHRHWQPSSRGVQLHAAPCQGGCSMVGQLPLLPHSRTDAADDRAKWADACLRAYCKRAAGDHAGRCFCLNTIAFGPLTTMRADAQSSVRLVCRTFGLGHPSY